MTKKSQSPGREQPPRSAPLAVLALGLITFGIYYVSWWYFINREMADLGR